MSGLTEKEANAIRNYVRGTLRAYPSLGDKRGVYQIRRELEDIENQFAESFGLVMKGE